ncbi:dTMP kinase [Aquicella lusitana]|uniref:Thymidylate kinase n=1 Tax=Aquicella lusitana TaxID=254246 RepID=A0A370GQQ9_9COXI|nr:dTMP kinase [Aquicella lusitana]RDI46017.1 thymidylate kinase [Aquicella lusitana]VVC73386.1 Thymidylate kinase [Aquicella lusitana]
MTRGKLITIEGIEGAGKSTALQFIQDYLVKAGVEVVLTREPGGTDVSEAIRKLLLHSTASEGIAPETELLLMFASRAQHISQCIEPTLSAGKWVVSDRYVDASYAYQGGGRGIAMDKISLLDKMIVDGLYPDLTFLLDVPADLGIARAEKRGTQKDRIEQEKTDFFVRVRNVYLERAKADPERIRLIDATLGLGLVQDQVRRILDEFIRKK